MRLMHFRVFQVTTIVLAMISGPLQHAKIFAIGGVGYAGTMSEGEAALRSTIVQKDAISLLQSAVAHARRQANSTRSLACASAIAPPTSVIWPSVGRLSTG